MRKFSSILVANRGEIAVRVLKTAGALGYRTIAVYSDADADALHVSLADEAVNIGPGPAAQSYLNADAIIAAALATGAGAVHPGYGFLSENAGFAAACQEAGLVFIGPSPTAIEVMGDKAEAKRRMITAGVPCVPGYQGQEQSDAVLIAEAEKLGFPIMVKAAAGGGGRGMRLVHGARDLPDALHSARAEARAAFGSDTLILEKAVQHPRHVEVQVFADSQGTTLHLAERDCPVRRRHQKVIEEAPCPVMTPDLRAAMGKAATDAARAINYCGAGTVEFLLDRDGAFYFLEMNTRLQVEHPVTEMVTGLDLVAMQIDVAQGRPLTFAQDDIAVRGHAIEARLYAEDADEGFLPRTGTMDVWHPAAGDGLRVDSGIQSGSTVSPFYDPMLAKVIAWGPDRDTARARLITALRDTVAFGCMTNRRFLMDVLDHPEFADGSATTGFIGDHLETLLQGPARDGVAEAAMAAVLRYQADRDAAQRASLPMPDELLNWSSGGALCSRYVYAHLGVEHDLLVTASGPGSYGVQAGDRWVDIATENTAPNHATMRVDGARIVVHVLADHDAGISLAIDGRVIRFDNLIARDAPDAETQATGQVLAPMHGAVSAVFVTKGERVAVGQRLAVLEAMKMQHDIVAEIAGTLTTTHVAAGDTVAANALMFVIDA